MKRWLGLLGFVALLILAIALLVENARAYRAIARNLLALNGLGESQRSLGVERHPKGQANGYGGSSVSNFLGSPRNGYVRLDYSLDDSTPPLHARLLRRATQETYGAALETLQLSQEQISQIKSILVGISSDSTEALEMLKQRDVKLDFEAVRSVGQTIRSSAIQQIEQLAGRDVANRISAFLAEDTPLYQAQEDYGAMLTFAGEPLSPEQTVSLASTIQTVDQVFDPNPMAPHALYAETVGARERAMITQASAYLNPEQHDAFAGYIKLQSQDMLLNSGAR